MERGFPGTVGTGTVVERERAGTGGKRNGDSPERWEVGTVWNGNGKSVERDEGKGMPELVELASCSTHLTSRSSADETAQLGGGGRGVSAEAG